MEADLESAFEGLAHPYKLNVEGSKRPQKARGEIRERPEVRQAFATAAAPESTSNTSSL